MLRFNTSLPELSFDKSINICGFRGQSIGGHRKMKQLGCKAGMRLGKLGSDQEGRIGEGLLQVQGDDTESYEIFQILELGTWLQSLATAPRQAGNLLSLQCQVLPCSELQA